MPQPCEQAEVIRKQGVVQEQQGAKIDTILVNQKQHAEDFREAITKLTDILVASTKHTERITQLKKETDLLFVQDRELSEKVESQSREIKKSIQKLDTRLDGIDVLAAQYTGANILTKVENLNSWMLREQGIHKFIPAAISFLTGLAALYVFFTNYL